MHASDRSARLREIAKRCKKIFRQFSHYTVIGVIATLFYIGLISLTIDRWGFDPLFATLAVTIFVFLIKFYAYVLTRFMHGRILPFVAVNAVSAAISAAIVVLLIEVVHMSAFSSSIIVTGVVFVLRFLLMKKVQLVRESDSQFF